VLDFTQAILPMQDGSVVISGRDFSSGLSPVLRWDGVTFVPLGSPVTSDVLALCLLSDGRVVLGGQNWVAESISIALWDGTQWSALGSGVDGRVFSLASLPNGELAVGGTFFTAGEHVSAYFARYSFTGIPTVARQPQPQTLTPGATLTLSATPSAGYSNVSVQWLRNGLPIAGGPGGASPGGGTVTGAAGALVSPTDDAHAVLTIAGVQPSDAGAYSAVFTNTCGTIETAAADVRADTGCAADLTGDGQVDSGDLQQFITAFVLGDAAADLTGDGQVDSGDLQLFITAFLAGC
jgi:hypothetical protein